MTDGKRNVLGNRGVKALLVGVISLLFVLPAWAEHAGEITFSDPGHTVPETKEWREKKLQRPDWAAGASMAIALDQHLYHVYKPIIDEFAEKKNIKIAVMEGTCGVTSGLLIKKQVDMGGYCCPPGHMDRLPGLRFHTVGIGGLALIVNKANDMTNITLEQARDVFKGKIYRWTELDPASSLTGNDSMIRTIGRLHCKHRPGHWRLLLSNEDLFSPRMKEVGTIKDMMSIVAENKGAIGYEVAWNIQRYEVADRVKFLNIDGYSPLNKEHLAKGNYPLYRTYNITSWVDDEDASPEVAELVNYLLGHVDRIDPAFGIVSASFLRENGWIFNGDEIVGEPKR
ncbi:MAG: hypothetical protein OEV64_03010 [Desulfobulbaceae bacterium]|nr:hypothetical protein [Desulfobulbaceae bacterium]